MKYVHLLGCDIDCGHHGCFSDPHKAIEKARELLEKQPFHMECKADDLYVEVVEIDSDYRELYELPMFISEIRGNE
jgi:hypothetical protein